MDALKIDQNCQVQNCCRCNGSQNVQGSQIGNDPVCGRCIADEAFCDAVRALRTVPEQDRWNVLQEVGRLDREEKVRQEFLKSEPQENRFCECCGDEINDAFEKLCGHCSSLTPAQLELAMETGCPF